MLKIIAFAVIALPVNAAVFAAEPPPPPLPKNARGAVAAKKPVRPKSLVVVFAERDIARLNVAVKKLSQTAKTVKDKKAKAAADAAVRAVAVRLDFAKKRLQFLRKTPKAIADPKRIRLVATYRHNRPLISCRFSADGRYLFGGAMDSSLHRWNIADGSRSDLAGHQSWIRRFAIDPHGRMLVTGAYAGRLIWWNPDDPSPKPLRTVEAHQGFVRGVDISPDGRFVASGGNDTFVRVWSATDGKLVVELPGHKRHVYNVRFDPTGRFLLSGDLMGVVKQWEVGSWKHVRDLDAKVLTKYDKNFRADCGGIRGMDFSPDGKQLVVCGIGSVTNAFAGVGKPTAVLFDMKTGKRLQVMLPAKNYRGTCWSVRFHPSGKFLVGAGGGSGMLWFWKPGASKSFFAYKVPGCAYDVSFHPDGLRLAVALYDRTVRIYDLGPGPKPAKPKKRSRRRRKR
ncbi:MAG: WD40 repeat domain-containing protein [Planctomycetes bacterium]|nr:WD40 repeat domain-containing protein [Planctomycetota bacterium]